MQERLVFGAEVEALAEEELKPDGFNDGKTVKGLEELQGFTASSQHGHTWACVCL